MAKKKPVPYVEAEGVRINPELVHLLGDASELIPDPKNPRTHGERNLEAIKRSLMRFGFQLPVIYNPDTMQVIVGHGRLQVARRLGWGKVPRLPFRGTVAEARAFLVADNRTAELADWDNGLLRDALEDLRAGDVDLGDVGFSPEEVAEILVDFHPIDEDPPRLDEKSPTTCPNCGHEF